MIPWRMMNEWGVPPVYLHSLLYRYAKRPADKGQHLPALAVAGGFSFEDQIFKGLAIGAPFVKLVGMARAPIAAAMVDKTIGRTIDENQVPVYIERFRSRRIGNLSPFFCRAAFCIICVPRANFRSVNGSNDLP